MVTRRKNNPLVWALAALAVFITALWQQRTAHEPPSGAVVKITSPTTAGTSAPANASNAIRPEASTPVAANALSAIPTAERAQLEKTLALIARGGPFPYSKDGSLFSNREALLPAQPRGYYREYTVPTPGESTRGARRVVRGQSGETWYTRDHYKTFVRIDE